MPTLLSGANTKALPTSKTMRYEVVEAAGSHVLRDVLLDEFCTLPDQAGRSVLGLPERLPGPSVADDGGHPQGPRGVRGSDQGGAAEAADEGAGRALAVRAVHAAGDHRYVSEQRSYEEAREMARLIADRLSRLTGNRASITWAEQPSMRVSVQLSPTQARSVLGLAVLDLLSTGDRFEHRYSDLSERPNWVALEIDYVMPEGPKQKKGRKR
ncbi:hypothetical protein [Kitasatospora sp. McL0602]|uniref:hypothetical protein n=1 Tax=Kitasatospora sp. McL0602 TaxID=3439530 RepID=UPI003F8B15A6